MTHTYHTLKFSIEQGVASIILNRPEAANGLNMELGRELMLASIEASEHPEVRAVLLSAEGKMFCAGGDLKAFAAYGDALPQAIKELAAYLHSAISRLNRMQAPLIIAVNGMAAGAGMSLAVCGDVVLAARSAKFTMAYTAAGLSPDGGASFFLPRLIGLRKAQELMLTNRRLSAQEALDWGLITQVVDDDALLREAQALAQQLAQGATQAFGTVKHLLNQSFNNTLETQMELEAQGITQMTKTQDGKEGITAFLEKRSANFSGK